jgi:hypothetical protein
MSKKSMSGHLKGYEDNWAILLPKSSPARTQRAHGRR